MGLFGRGIILRLAPCVERAVHFSRVVHCRSPESRGEVFRERPEEPIPLGETLCARGVWLGSTRIAQPFDPDPPGLARNVGDALHSAYKGDLQYEYVDEGGVLRVTWTR